MSQLEAFGQHLKETPELQARLREAESEDALVEQVLAEAEALGYALSADEVRQRLALNQENVELSDAELGTVTGGATMGIICRHTRGLTCGWPC